MACDYCDDGDCPYGEDEALYDNNQWTHYSHLNKVFFGGDSDSVGEPVAQESDEMNSQRLYVYWRDRGASWLNMSNQCDVDSALDYMRSMSQSSAYEYSFAAFSTTDVFSLTWRSHAQVVRDLQNIRSNSTQHTSQESNMAARLLFAYTIILHARPQKDNSGNDVTPDSTILQPRKEVIAASAEQARLIAARDIPTSVPQSDLSQVEIVLQSVSRDY